MFRQFYPTVYVESAYTVDFQKLYDKGYRSLILDVDNTLVEHGAPSDEKAVAFFKYLKDIGFKTCIISNNDLQRVKPFADAVGSPYIFDAKKPSKKGYAQAMSLLKCGRDKALFMGDQLFTDVWGANKAGIRSILVKPIKMDTVFKIRLKRLGEKIVMPFFFRHREKCPGEHRL